MQVAIIGFGEAGQAFAASLSGAGASGIAAYDRSVSEPMRASAARLGVRLTEGPRDAAAGAALVISAVTASESLDAALPLSGVLEPSQIFLDINSVSGGKKRETASRIGPGYRDFAVMGPVHPAGHRTKALLSGPETPVLAALDFRFERVGEGIGGAATIKLIRSLFVKGLEALTVEALTAAALAGESGRVLASLAASFPGLDWPAFAAYEFERVATHGRRRAEEMDESARTYAELGRPEGEALARAIAASQRSGAGRARLP